MTTEAEKAISVLENTASLLQKTRINLSKCPKQRLSKIGYLKTRIQTIEEYWTTFRTAHQDLLKCTTREERGLLPYFVNEEFFIQEDVYLCLLGDLKEMLAACSRGAADTNNSSDVTMEEQMTKRIKLPTINIPVFSGDYEAWPAFKDIYESLVHNCATLSDVEKLHYLKTSITGEAASLLKHIHMTGANYTEAWGILTHRYGNKRLIVNALLRRLFMQKKCTGQTSAQLKNLLDSTNEILNSLKNIDVSVDSWDPIIIFLVVQKLDPESHKEWEQVSYTVNTEELPRWMELCKFLEAKFRSLELVNPSITSKPTKDRVLHVTTSENTMQKLCVLCKDVHTLSHCNIFNKMSIKERGEHVKTNKLCFNCLGKGHPVFKCRVPMSCRLCKRRHHTLLHQTDASEYQVEVKQPTSHNQGGVEEKNIQAMVASHSYTGQKIALLATAVVILKGEHGHTTALKALIDSGSQACFISEKATQILKLNRSPVNLIVSGMESMNVRVKHEVEVEVLSRWDKSFSLPIKAYVMSKHLTSNISPDTLVKTDWPHIAGIQLADEKFYEPGNIDLLLGVNEYVAIMKHGILKGPPGTPCAQNTYLGWILMGGLTMKPSEEERSIRVMKLEVNIDDLLKAIWEVDSDTKRKLTQNEQLCEDIYNKTHMRDKFGKYIVKLPFKSEKPRCIEEDTREIANRRLMHLERRFSHNQELKEEYTKVINEYIHLKHVEEVPTEELSKKSVYLPHHAVIRTDKETTKTRVVFDASCKGSNGISLNEELLSGPVIQGDLRSLIMRWRTHAVCFVADIEKMYRMIWINNDDKDYQRILWRYDSADHVKDYRLLTVTFGTASAPYLAVKTLMQLAEDEGDQYPEAARIVREDFYVDDVMSGGRDLEQAVQLSRDLKKLLRLGGFELKKWASNSREFMETVDPKDRSSNAHLELNVDGIVKALGVNWNLGNDTFEYKLILSPISNIITKRTILSDIQKLFDPLGWIAPCILLAKILIQQLWLERVNWDQPLNSTLIERWTAIRSDFENVNGIYINRWLGITNLNQDTIELHGFSDASNQAYSAVVYCRVCNSDGTSQTNIIAARTRVAPLKTISLPRLELCGAVILSRLLKQVAQAMKIPSSHIYAWTDSSIVLCWLNGDPNKWKSFVANRVVEITANINNHQWNHVKSCDNPADIASRGMSVANLRNSKLWWYGPEWLQRKIQFTKPKITETDLERKGNLILVVTKTKPNEMEIGRRLHTQFEDFEKLIDLLRRVSFCKRFFNQKSLKDKINSAITTDELHKSLQICIQRAQEEEFSEEVETLKLKNRVKRSSKLRSLDPYFDSDGLIRVGGRLKNADLSEEIKHPIILGRKGKLTFLIVADAHSKTLHGGVHLMLNYLRSKYWILNAKSLVKQCIHRCLICAKQNARVRSQIMGNLPSARVTPARAFSNSGIDFIGPIIILQNKGRGAKTSKAYIAIFICMSTKAIHLELVGDLTSAAFIGAFKRFCARRGRCNNLWSDQGRNFIGANKELTEAWKEARLQFDGEVSELLANDGTQWHFIPAYSPNFGGLWEAGVKSVKYHLKRILNTKLTFEEFTTVLCEIEACLNSRPLCPLNDSTVEPLTPGHFLISEAPITVPEVTRKDVNISYLSRWQYTQKLLNDFWSRWQTEYLTRLQQRPKWLKREEEFKLGDIVLIKQDNLPPGKWLMGRIIDKHPGNDGITRVYSVKCGEHITKRCVSKLCPLPINTSTD